MTQKEAADQIADYLQDVFGYTIDDRFGNSGGRIVIYVSDTYPIPLMKALELEDDLNQGGTGYDIVVQHRPGTGEIEVIVQP
jgi:hypothetical protein